MTDTDVLVIYAGKMGSTRQIADAISEGVASSADLRGDSRDWDAIRVWAGGIRRSLVKTPKHSDSSHYTGPAIAISPLVEGSRHHAPPLEDDPDPHALSNLW